MSDAPCFCMPLQKGAKIFSLVDMAVNLVHAIALVAMCFVWKLSALMDYFEDKQKAKPGLEASKYKYSFGSSDNPISNPIKDEDRPSLEDLQIFIALLSVSILIHLVFFGLAFMLFAGNKNARITRIWFIATIVLTLVLFIIAIVLFVNKYVTFTAFIAQFRGSWKKYEDYVTSVNKLSGEEYEKVWKTKETPFLAVLGFPVCEMITVVYKIYEIVLAYCLMGGGGGGGGGGNATGAPSRAQQSTATGKSRR